MLKNMIQSRLDRLMVKALIISIEFAVFFQPIKIIIFIYSGTDSYPHDNGIVRALNSTYKPNERVVGDPKYTIFVGRLHLKTDEVKHFGNLFYILLQTLVY